jgi:cell wall assembly regulator SMI1
MPTSGPDPAADLFSAVKKGNVSAVRELLAQGVDPNSRDRGNETPLMAAARDGNLEIFGLLQQAGADLAARAKDKNLTLFHAAACPHGNEAVSLEMLQRLIQALGSGADKNALSLGLVLSCADRSTDHVRALLRSGADPNFTNSDKEFPLLVAVWENRPETAVALLEGGANPNATVPPGKTFSFTENIPRRYWHRPIIELTQGKRLRKVVEFLSKAGASPSPRGPVSDVVTSWERIEAWLRTHAPQWTPLHPGATEQQLAEAQAKLNLTFPSDLRACYAKHNGSQDFFPGIDTSRYLMPLSEIAQHWEMLARNLDAGEFAGIAIKADIGIAPVFWHKSWVPLISNGGGNCHCLDLAPSAGGEIGQILSFNHENGERWLIAASLRTWLSDLADELETGQLHFAEGQGFVNAPN